MDVDAEITTEVEEEIEANHEEDDTFMNSFKKQPTEINGLKATKVALKDQKLVPKLDPSEWKLEVERGMIIKILIFN